MIDLREVLTIPEAAEKYSVSEATLKFACAGRAAGGKTYPPPADTRGMSKIREGMAFIEGCR